MLNRPDVDRVSKWGSGYFSVDSEGALRIHPRRGDPTSVRLRDVVAALSERGFDDPLLLRFPQILSDRQDRIRSAFDAAIAEEGYPARYRGVMPVKVNHDRVVLETLVRSGQQHGFGLEVGSKAELCLALTLELHPEAPILCNGFKDKDYLELAVHALRHGRRVIVIAENPQEIRDIHSVAARHDQKVPLGFRARLHTEGTGRWQESTGNKGKFGLSTMEIVEGLEFLEQNGRLDDLILLHFHIGSQVCDILNVKEAIKEASRLYCEMKRRAPSLHVLDVGGGLGVDYDGSKTATDWSVNYSLDEYARDAVYIVKDVCDRCGIEPPDLVSESGRAIVAHHAVMILSTLRIVGAHEQRDYSRWETTAHQVKELESTLESIGPGNYREAFHDATILVNELHLGFKLGYVGLLDRAVGESLYRDICERVKGVTKPRQQPTRDMIELERQLAPKYVCNFSVFMSAPDSWAVQQLFPVCPIEGMHDPQRAPATIGDITCDSDGKLERFIGAGEPQPFIQLHHVAGGAPYHIGMFLVGAYQDVLGDFHNLFGTPNEGVIEIDGLDAFSVVDCTEGSSVEQSLDYFGFAPADMVRGFDRQIDRTRDRECIKEYKGAFLRVLHGNTYLHRS